MRINKYREYPSAEYLRECLDYSAGDGSLRWKQRPMSHFRTTREGKIWNTKYAERPAFYTRCSSGYLQGGLDGRLLLAHRVAFIIHTGQFPEGEIDHINGDRQDNSAANLRLVDSRLNKRNAALPSHNTSGCVGVAYRAAKGKWRASICLDGRAKHIGYFESEDEARRARLDFASRHGFHPNHGRENCA